jgi:hypothetical protein
MTIWVVITKSFDGSSLEEGRIILVETYSKDPGINTGITYLSCGCCGTKTQVFETELVEVA